MPDKPDWKDAFLDRAWMRDRVDDAFTQAAMGDYDERIGTLLSELELYFAYQMTVHLRENLTTPTKILQDALASLKEVERQLGREQLRKLGIMGTGEQEEKGA